MSERPTIRQAASDRKPLGGPDAQALEGALQQVERELAIARQALNDIEGFDIDWSKGTGETVNAIAEIARRALSRLNTASPAEPQYPCGCCGALRMKGQGVTTFTVCDHCYDNCMHGRPHVPESPAEKPAQIPVASPSGSGMCNPERLRASHVYGST